MARPRVSVLPVRVDPVDLQVVFVDFAAIDVAEQTKEAAEREVHARRQAEVLANRR